MNLRIRDGQRRRCAAADLRAAALLRGVPARARLPRGARHHRAHLRHLPGRLPDERLPGDGGRAAASRSTSQSARCAGCSTAASGSRATRCTSSCSTRPTSSATTAPSRWRATSAAIVEQALALKKAGNEIIRVVGGREIHPVNVRVGGFYRAPRPRELRALVEPLERARELALETVRFTGGARRPRLRARPRVRRALDARTRTRSRAAGSSRPAGLDIAPASTRSTSRSSTSRTRPRCTRGCASGGAYLCGPLARYALNSAQLSPLAREAAAEAGPRRRRAATRSAASSCARRDRLRARRGAAPHRGLRGARRARSSRSSRAPATGYGATEAPRGLL